MKLVIGTPVLNQYELTREHFKSVVATVGDPDTYHQVVFDNGSVPVYESTPGTDVIHNGQNRGFYYPLKQLAEAHPDADLIGLMHNDVFFYEYGWDLRVKDCFATDPKLGLIGLVGSSQVDSAGGRGGGTMMNFRGAVGQQQAGIRLTDLAPAVCLDSLFMVFRREVIPSLLIDENITLCHFYDKIWTMRTIEAGWRVGVLGIDIDHMGGQTSTTSDYDQTARAWCEKRGIPVPQSGDLAMYLEAERRWLTEYRDQKHFIPCSISPTYEITYPDKA